jgi:hypothetical protein
LQQKTRLHDWTPSIVLAHDRDETPAMKRMV